MPSIKRDREDIQRMVNEGMSHADIAKHYGTKRRNISDFIQRNKIIKHNNYEYTLSKNQEKQRQKLVEKYAHKFYGILKGHELNPDLHDIISLLSFQSIKCAKKYDSKRGSFAKYCIQHFWWIFKNYRKQLLKNII